MIIGMSFKKLVAACTQLDPDPRALTQAGYLANLLSPPTDHILLT